MISAFATFTAVAWGVRYHVCDHVILSALKSNRHKVATDGYLGTMEFRHHAAD
jgi:hypothetical protein